MRFRVWAPRAQEVRLVLRGAARDMGRGEGGWWTAEVAPEDARDVDYGFSIDGADPLPDPRSPRQPDGVHAASRTVDHDAFPWTDAGWRPAPLSAGILYELHVGTFTPEGTFDAAIERLGHLGDLGVTHVEVMPVNAFPGTHGWGYDGVDIYAPHEAYGGPDGLKRFVDACHARGLAVILDVVYNHFGPSGNYLERFGPYLTEQHRTPWGSAVNFDGAGSDEVRRFVCDNAAMWVRDYHVDGLRLDAVHAIYDSSATHILEQLATELHALEGALGRRVSVIAESDLNDPRLLRSRECGGYAQDAQWSDDFHHALHVVLAGERHGYYADFHGLADLAKAYEDAYVYGGRYSPHRDRVHGRAVGDLSGERFVVFLQNHDQVGNRARGERMGHLVDPGLLKVGVALLLTSPFVPLLFQGEEWGATAPFQYFTAHEEPELAEAVCEGRRREFAAFSWEGEVPDPQAAETFARSKLDWAEIDREPHRSLLVWYGELITLRRRRPELGAGSRAATRASFDDERRWFILERGGSVVACNLARTAQPVPLPRGPAREIVLASEGDARLDGEGLLLPAHSVAVVLPRES